jgi:hypothetical protein
MNTSPIVQLKVLDLFAGLGGFSAAFKDRGHLVHTLDNGRDILKKNANQCTFNMDIKDFSCNPGEYDIILAGVPCTEYARYQARGYNPRLRDCPPPTNELLKATIGIINHCQPKYWAIENVRGAVRFISALIGSHKKKIGCRWFWGHFPDFVSDDKWYKTKFRPGGSLYKRGTAKKLSSIEYPISLAFCIAMETSILNARHQNLTIPTAPPITQNENAIETVLLMDKKKQEQKKQRELKRIAKEQAANSKHIE